MFKAEFFLKYEKRGGPMEKKQIAKLKISFDELAQHTEEGIEFWYARDLMPYLGYEQWRNFENAIKNAIISCGTMKIEAAYHFAEVSKMIEIGKGGRREVKDYMRKMLNERGIKPEELPPAEDIKKLERKVKSQEKKMALETETFKNDRLIETKASVFDEDEESK